jgi:carboxyl-terminal processing protease
MKQGEAAADGIRRYRRPTVGLRIVGWTALLGVVLFCGLIAVSMFIVRDKDRRAKDEFAKLPPHERRLAIYDAFWNQVSAHYYDQRFTGFDWKTIRREWREKAAGASGDLDLYNSVMLQVVVRFPGSHVGITPPHSFLAPVATSDRAVQEGNNVLLSKNLFEILQNDLGFEPVEVQRGNIRAWLVGDVSMGSPADRAGIEPGWYLQNQNLTLSGSGAAHYSGDLIKLESFEQKVSLEQHVYLAQGHTPEDIDSYLAAHKVSVNFDVTAPSAPRPQPLTQNLDGGVLYIRFDTFKEPLIIDKVLAAVGNADHHGLILDLRGNTGGLAAQERRLLSRLLPARSILGYTMCSSDTEPWRASILGRHYEGPMIVLIGPRSASAAEIVADAVKVNHRGLLIGRITNGSVLNSGSFPLPDGGSATIPVCDFLGPDKKRIEGVDVEPDIEIIPTLNDIRAGHDLVLERAERELRKGI